MDIFFWPFAKPSLLFGKFLRIMELLGRREIHWEEKFMYKIIACDLDETLLGEDRKVCKRDLEAIKKARELGVKFVPATGRGFRTIKGTLEELELLDEKGEYVISFNGGAITENKGNRMLHFEGIPFAIADELYKRGLAYDVCIHVYTKEVVYVYNYVQSEKGYLTGRMEVTEIHRENIDFLKGQEIVKVLYMNTDNQYLRWIEGDLKDITGGLDVSYSSNRYLEFNLKGVNKGNGLLRLAELLGIKREETIAIGDHINDLSMIEAAGLGVGVRNAVEEVKERCDYITEATNNEGGVAEVIEKFVIHC